MSEGKKIFIAEDNHHFCELYRMALGAEGYEVHFAYNGKEALEKIPAIQAAELQWHLIGHLQSNKVKTALELFSLIQSVDSVRLAKKISEEAVVSATEVIQVSPLKKKMSKKTKVVKKKLKKIFVKNKKKKIVKR